MPEANKPVDQLRALHKEEASGELKRPDILVVEGVDDVREIVVALLRKVFPGYNILSVADGAEAGDKISNKLRDSLALVFADTEDWDAVLGLLSALRRHEKDGRIVDHGKKVPVIFTSASVPPDKGPVLEKTLENGTLDGFIPKPFTPDSLSAVLTDSIAKRAGLFEEIERAAKARVIDDFIKYYSALIQTWRDNLHPLMAEITGDMLEDLRLLLAGIESFGANLAKMSMDISSQDLRKLIHDINNNLTVLVSFSDYVLGYKMEVSAKKTLSILKAEVQKLTSNVSLIGRANKGDISWASADQPKLTPEAEQVLRCPVGTRFCVIDDNENVRNVCERVIKDAGGNLTLTVSGQKDMQNLVDAHAAGVEIDVFLLDHELGDGVFGHQFIETIRTCYPNALIICHSGAAAEVNKDAENPYRRVGIEVVGKREWSAVSGIVRRKLDPAKEA